MTRWFDLAPADEEFVDTAKLRFPYPMDLPVPPEQVWAALTGDEPLSWCRMLSAGRYTSDRPFGVGTTRTIRAGGVLRLRERFFRWEEGRRHSFTVVQASLPGFRRFAEDYLVEPTATGCRFTWTFAMEPAFPLTAAGPLSAPVAKALFGSLASDTRKHFGGSR